jgi:hypothetical protein
VPERWARLDAWIRGGDTTRTSLARYRVVYAVVALLIHEDLQWVTAFPDAMYNPPPGLMRAFSGFPSAGVLGGLELARTVLLVAVLVGLFTRASSFLLVAVTILGYGFTFSLGKVDHTILLLVVPAFMALAGWGDRASVDAWRRRGRGAPEPAERAEQWPLRLFALVIGLAFLTAAVPKLLAGWLAPASHAVQSTQLQYYASNGVTTGLAPFFAQLRSGLFWEPVDWATIALEAGMVLAVLTWRGARVGFAVAALFHLGVYLMLDIAFIYNVVTYGFVVQWDRLRLPRPAAPARPAAPPRPPSPHLLAAAPVLVVLAAVALYAAEALLGSPRELMRPLLVFAGAAVGAGYLAWLARDLLRHRRGAPPVADGPAVIDLPRAASGGPV